MKSTVRNAVPTGTKGPSLEAMVTDTMAAMAELAQQSRRAATSTATSTEAPTRSAELSQPSRRAAAPVATPAAARGGASAVSDSMRSAAIAGWAIIAIFFGGFGAWAVTAPLNGAVVANGFVKVETNRKSVQHLDGGIVKELRVKEGDWVNAGDVLIVLDDTQARAEYDVLRQQYLVLRATEERLRGELAQRAALTIPDEFKALADDPVFSAVWRGQVSQFESRLSAIAGQRNVISEKIAQLEAQISGGEAQAKAYKAQLESVKKERDDIEPLVKRGLIAQPRYLQLERSGAGLEGQAADTLANIAKARQAIAEQVQQMAQLDYDRMTEVNKDLRDTQAKLLEVIPKLSNAKAVLSRMEIRSPYTGYIVGLTAFSVGGVITKGDKILDIVPQQESLVIEAQIPVDDISEVHPNMRADVHLTAYKARITPVVRGTATVISADRLTDSKSGNSYFTALVSVDQDELAALPNVRLYPGMPATVMFPTVERTAFNYVIGPLVMSFNRAFRQK
jgi:HlyD family type I secretion membrane fusion protein